MIPALGPSATVSVVICCYSQERWADLAAAVASIITQEPAPHEIVIVVDHNPALRSLAQDTFADPVSRIAVVENHGPRGLSSARNTGILATTGDIIAFLDDDAQAGSGMLAVLAARVREPGVLGAAARIVPEWRGAEPSWFPEEFLWTVGCTYRGLDAGPVRNLIGAAMAMRRQVFEVGGFVTDLGRGEGRLPFGCEETELCIRAMRNDPTGRFVYDSAALCRHKVSGERLTLRYLLRRCYAEGLSKARLVDLMPARNALATERVYVRRVLPFGVLRGLGELMRGRLSGAGRAGAICLAFGTTVAGYGFGRVRGRLRSRPAVQAAEAA